MNVTRSWHEQREMTYVSIDALANHSVVADIQRALDDLQPQRPDLTGELQVLGSILKGNSVLVALLAFGNSFGDIGFGI